MDTLLPHQHEAVQFLADRQFGFLGDDMGLGKTIEATAAADQIGAQRILVIVPGVVRVNWKREFLRWQRLPREITVALTAKEAAHAAAHGSGVLIISYEIAVAIAPVLRRQSWDLLVLDEAHRLKNPRAKRTRMVYGAGCRRGPDSIAASAKRVWALSGSPILGGQHEFFSHARALWPYGGPGWPLTYEQWMQRYTQGFESPYGWRVTGSANSAELLHATEHFMLRRRVEDVMTLPEVIEGEVTVPLAAPDLALLNQMLTDVPELPAFLREAATAGTGWGSEPIAAARRLLAWAKVTGAVELLETELEGGVDKIIVFGHHREPLQALHKALAPYNPVLVQGGTSPAQVQEAVDAFQRDPTVRVFVGNIQAAGVGITLTASHHVRFVEADWTPALNRQAMMRARRIGQHRTVFVTFMVADHPLDDALSAIIARKTRILRDFET